MSYYEYTPMFRKLCWSSVWRKEPDHVRLLWVTMLLWQDRDHVVRMDEFALSEAAVLPLDKVKDGLEILSGPDRWKPDQEGGGARIERVDQGWKVLKGQEYQGLMSLANRMHAASSRQARYRAKKQKGNGTPRDMEMPRSTAECERAEMRKEMEERKEVFEGTGENVNSLG